MIIYKPSLKSFLSEAHGTVYLQGHCSQDPHYVKHQISVSGFNISGKPIIYTFCFSNHLTGMTDEWKKAIEKSKQLEERIQKEIEEARFLVREGIVATADKPMEGAEYKI